METAKPIENIKAEAKKYYKGKNMIPRYIVIGFLLILIILQFILPKPKIEFLEKNDEAPTVIEQDQNSFNFLGNEIDLVQKNIFFKNKLEQSLSQIMDKEHSLEYLINNKAKILYHLDTELTKNKIPSDFKFLTLVENQKIIPISLEAKAYFGLQIDTEIDETLDYKKMTNLLIQYLETLYKDFKDRDLTLIGYLIGAEDLKSLMMSQNQVEIEHLYLPQDASKVYFDMIAYKQIFEKSKFEIIGQTNITSTKLGETKDLAKRANKNGHSYQEIKELNPWILGNNLPKGKRELEVFKK